MTLREKLARIGLRSALDTRQEANTSWSDPICIYDFVERMGTEVWFVGGASFAGMYAKGYGRLFVPAERPVGRKAFTCAHELAHLRFDHGSRVEELEFDRSDNEVPDEMLANIYAAHLLMPRQAVETAFSRRNSPPEKAGPIDFYCVANQLGVGYETLLKHMHWSLRMIEYAKLQELLAVSPKDIRKILLGRDGSPHLIFATEHWHKVAIDLEIGDYAIIPRNAQLNGPSAKLVGICSYGQVVEGVKTGISQAMICEGDWAAMIRVSRRQFAGRCIYRHMEDSDED
ncbi:MAG: ImmA/IrrE family metallo-endopeptidase [Chthoniobacterales bacterium]|nr:ImmA/IrrE family metallo-endopeptidase [Chthoniobacterales bacterium]